MKQIPLTRGMFALVDDADFEWLSRWKWHAHRGRKRGTFYAQRTNKAGGRQGTVRMHRALLDSAVDDIDHIDGDGLNNQRSNLREASPSQNLANRGKQANNTSGYKGVTWCKAARKWQAQIMVKRGHVYLGLFTDLIEAARAYDRAALRYFGVFAQTNFRAVGDVGAESEMGVGSDLLR